MHLTQIYNTLITFKNKSWKCYDNCIIINKSKDILVRIKKIKIKDIKEKKNTNISSIYRLSGYTHTKYLLNSIQILAQIKFLLLWKKYKPESFSKFFFSPTFVDNLALLGVWSHWPAGIINQSGSKKFYLEPTQKMATFIILFGLHGFLLRHHNLASLHS